MAITNGSSVDHATAKNRVVYSSFNLWSGFLFGLGFAAFVDEAIFHQLLHWHHFYDQSTTNAGLVSDGIFHAFSWFATVASLFMYANLRRRKGLWPKRWIGGAFLGTGSFQLYDGLIQHKVMKLHQIRYGVDLFVYDLVWNIIALILMAIGIYLLLRTRKISNKIKAER
ncbi:DUF2243 domain-containing protein [Planomicrobium sp. CPCC 101079]|uniref:DUF2243 domain-containing protein n=1 Tax=Planomicrobium sp. CPCC 101079 TaxID=2599618 RepID=UPI0011B7DE26|nr:DUF2243 domain-containing protein [Planomicrobium sp. CPCC 101079]TWT16026.1 DUF2243 domain-containing protein [Planomicrobium sp. CPCC 101079]